MPDSYFFNNSKAEIYYQDNHFNIWKFPSGICRQTTIYWWQSKALTKCPFTFLFHQGSCVLPTIYIVNLNKKCWVLVRNQQNDGNFL